jgi:hypothetical protein
MKKIYLLGFRGTGFADPQYATEPALIRAGHVGIAFEDDPPLILGFHPTEAEIARVGGEEAAIEWLKENEPLDGALQADYAIFARAYALSQAGARTEVWQMVLEVPDEEYERIRAVATRWYTEGTVFTYTFPVRGQLPGSDRDNCATFPRRLGLPIPEPSGQLTKYVAELEKAAERWSPREEQSDDADTDSPA